MNFSLPARSAIPRPASPAAAHALEIAPLGLIAAETAVGRLQRAPQTCVAVLARQARANLTWAADALEGLDASAKAPMVARMRAVEQALALGRW